MQTLVKTSKEIFNDFLNKGKPPFDYARKLLKEHPERLKSILRNENPPPYELEIQPSSICDANCEHCFAKGFIPIKNRIINKESADRIITQTLDFKKNGFKIENMKFCGTTGEPLVNPLEPKSSMINPFTLYMIDSFYGERYIKLFTNGIKIGENKFNKKALDSLAKLDEIYLSLYAGTT